MLATSSLNNRKLWGVAGVSFPSTRVGRKGRRTPFLLAWVKFSTTSSKQYRQMRPSSLYITQIEHCTANERMPHVQTVIWNYLTRRARETLSHTALIFTLVGKTSSFHSSTRKRMIVML